MWLRKSYKKPHLLAGDLNITAYSGASFRNQIQMEVRTQPGPFAPSDFQTGLTECCDDCGTCVFGYFCLPCLGCSIASDMGECCLCGLGMPMRSVYRTKYNIRGSMCNDYMVSFCCLPCATCQLKRDIDRRKQQGIF